jgi:hypothetical protein
MAMDRVHYSDFAARQRRHSLSPSIAGADLGSVPGRREALNGNNSELGLPGAAGNASLDGAELSRPGIEG